MRLEGVMSAVLGILACLFSLAGLASLYSGYDLGGTERGIAYTVSGTVALAAGALLFGLMCLSLHLSRIARLLALPAGQGSRPAPASGALPPHLEAAVPAAVGAAVAAAAADLALGDRPVVPLAEPEKPAGEMVDASQLPLDLRLADLPETAPPAIEPDFAPFDRLLAEERERAAAAGPDTPDSSPVDAAAEEPRKRPAWMDSVFPESAVPAPEETAVPAETQPADDGTSLLPELRGLPDAAQDGAVVAADIPAEGNAADVPTQESGLPAAEPGPAPEPEDFSAPAVPLQPVEEPEPALAPAAASDPLGTSNDALTGPAAPEPAVSPAKPSRPPAEGHAAPGRKVIGSYAVGRSSYTMYDDGSVEALTEAGLFSFSSLDELRAFIEQGPAARN